MIATAEATRHRRATIHPLRVSRVEPLTADSVAVEFDVPLERADDFDFVQGQHISVRSTQAGDDARRSYSICTPAGSGRLRIAVKSLPGGVFSAYARARLHPGDVLEVVTPTGHFNTPIDPSRARNYVMIAAGSGITPVLSIIATVLEREPASTVTLIDGNRTAADIMFLEELEDLKNVHTGRFAMYHALSREEQEWELLNGRIDRERLRGFLDTVITPADVDEWFLCGPRPMIDMARDLLTERGVDPRHVHFELFHAEGVAAPPTPVDGGPSSSGEDAGRAQVTIILDGRRSTFELGRHDERILDAALRVRSDAPYACKGGVCGTCRAMVVSGAVEMDQCYALDEPELEAGFVLACQSHPASEAVTLDFDQ